MVKTFTTSAQKTLSMPKDEILKKLEEQMTKNEKLVFKNTKRENIKEAKVIDGSKLIIASFEKESGKALAMIDHKNLPANKSRSQIQRSLRQKLDKMFK